MRVCYNVISALLDRSRKQHGVYIGPYPFERWTWECSEFLPSIRATWLQQQIQFLLHCPFRQLQCLDDSVNLNSLTGQLQTNCTTLYRLFHFVQISRQASKCEVWSIFGRETKRTPYKARWLFSDSFHWWNIAHQLIGSHDINWVSQIASRPTCKWN